MRVIKKNKKSILGTHFYTFFKFRVCHCDSIPFKMIDLVLHFISNFVHLLILVFTDEQMRNEMNYLNSQLVSQINLKPGVFLYFCSRSSTASR